MMNLVGLMGRLVSDPVSKIIKWDDKEILVTQYRLAIERDYKKNNVRPVDFIVCKSYASRAQYAKDYFHKGDTVVASGSIYTEPYAKEGEDKKSIFTYLHVKDNYLAKRRGDEQIRNRGMNPVQDGNLQNGHGNIEPAEDDFTDLPLLPEEDMYIPDIGDIPFR